MKISSVTLTKNEEKNIADCLESLKWCDERIVVDDNSEDNTAEIAKKNGAKVFSNPLNNDFSKQRNFGLEKAVGDWVLFVDADERVSEALAFEISTILRQTDVQRAILNGFYISRRDIIWKKELRYGETGNIKLLRLAKKEAGSWKGKVHEKWEIQGRTGVLKNPLFHYPHQSIEQFLQEINFYTDIRAKELFEHGISTNFLWVIIYPKAKFFLNYFLKLGFLDGIPGLIFAVLMSFHSFLVRGKLWLLWHKK